MAQLLFPLTFPITVSLHERDWLLETFIARQQSELRCRIEMLTGIGWLEALPLYERMVEQGCQEISDSFRVCHSYEKWGDWQQEVKIIRVTLQRLEIEAAA